MKKLIKIIKDWFTRDSIVRFFYPVDIDDERYSRSPKLDSCKSRLIRELMANQITRQKPRKSQREVILLRNKGYTIDQINRVVPASRATINKIIREGKMRGEIQL